MGAAPLKRKECMNVDFLLQRLVTMSYQFIPVPGPRSSVEKTRSPRPLRGLAMTKECNAMTKKHPRGDSNAQPTDKVPIRGFEVRLKARHPRGDSNAQPTDSKSGTLSIELRGRVTLIIPRKWGVWGKMKNGFRPGTGVFLKDHPSNLNLSGLVTSIILISALTKRKGMIR